MKLHLPLSLLAALLLACAGTNRAWATVANSDTNGDGTYDTRTFTGTHNGINTSNLANIETVVFKITGGHFDSGTYTFGSDITIQIGDTGTTPDDTKGLILNNGYGTKTHTFQGALTGSGVISRKGNASPDINLKFTGDTSGFNGNVKFAETSGGYTTIQFGSDTPATVSNNTPVVGNGTITFGGTNANDKVIYSFASGEDSTVIIGNTISTASGKKSSVELKGSGKFAFTKQTDITNLTLADTITHLSLSAGTIGTISGSAQLQKVGEGDLNVRNIGTQTLVLDAGSLSGSFASGTIAAGEGGKLKDFTLSGGTLDFGTIDTAGSTISAEGAVTLTSGNLFVDVTAEAISDHTQTDGTITINLLSGATNLRADDWTNFTLNRESLSSEGSATLSFASNFYTATLGTADNTLTLTLTGLEALKWGAGNGTWSTSQWGGEASYADNMAVNFDENSETTTVTISGTVTPGTIYVSGTYVFDSDSESKGSISGTAAMELSGSATIKTNNSEWAGAVNVMDGATLVLEGETALGSSALTIHDGTVTANADNALGSATITQGAGTINASAENALGTATITLNGGTLNATVSNVASEGATITVNSGSSLYGQADKALGSAAVTLNAGSIYTESAALGGTVTIGNAAGRIIKESTTGDAAVKLAGGQTLSTDTFVVKGGSMTLKSDGTLAFSKIQYTQAGTLILAADVTHAANSDSRMYATNGAIEIASDAKLKITGSDAFDWGNQLTLNVKGTLEMAGRNTVSDYHTINLEGGTITGGSLHVNVYHSDTDAERRGMFIINASGESSIDSIVFVSSTNAQPRGVEFNVAENGTLTMIGTLGDRGANDNTITTSSGTFKKTGDGTMVFSGSIKASAGFTIADGKLEIGSADALKNSATYTVATGATLDLGFAAVDAWKLAMDGGTFNLIKPAETEGEPAIQTDETVSSELTHSKLATLTSTDAGGTVNIDGSYTLEITAASGTYSGTIAGNGAVEVSGGTQKFAGSNTYAGGTTISGDGTLVVTSNAALGAAGMGVAMTRGTLEYNGTAGTDYDVIDRIIDGGGTGTILVSSGKVAMEKDANVGLFKAHGGANIVIREGATVTTDRMILHSLNTWTTETLTIEGATVNVTDNDKDGNDALNKGEQAALLIGHWHYGAGNLVVKTEGILNVLSGYTGITWDSGATLTVEGGSVNLYGVSMASDQRSSTGRLELKSGYLNIGQGGIIDANSASNKSIILSGGTLGVIDSDWSTEANSKVQVTGNVIINTGTTREPDSMTDEDAYTVTVGTGKTITLEGALVGNGDISKQGAGTLAFTGNTSGYTGTLTLTDTEESLVTATSWAGGTVKGSGTLGNFTLAGGSIDFGAVTKDGTTNETTYETTLKTAGTLTLTSGGFVLDLPALSIADGTAASFTLLTTKEANTGSIVVGNNGSGSFTLNGQTLVTPTTTTVNEETSLGLTTLSIGDKFYTATVNTTGTALTLNLELVQSTVWTGTAGDNIWKVDGSSNWTGDNGSDAQYADGLAVVFSGEGGTPKTVKIDGQVAPSAISVAAGSVYTFVDADNTTGGITGEAALDVAGTLTILNTNEGWNGTAEVLADATLVAGNTNALGTSLLMLSGGTFKVDGSAATADDTEEGTEVVLDEGEPESGSAAHLTVTLVGGVVVNADSVIEVAEGDTLKTTSLAGRGTLTKDGAGTLELAGMRSMLSGGIDVNGGVLKASTGYDLGFASLTFNGGKLEVDGSADAPINVIHSGKVSLAQGTGITVAQNDILTLTGTLTAVDEPSTIEAEGSARLVKTGAGTLELACAGNELTDGIEVQEGVLQASSANALGSADLTFSGENTKLVVDDLNAQKQVQQQEGTSLHVISTGAITLDKATTFEVGEEDTLTLAGSLDGEVVLTKSGAGTLDIAYGDSTDGRRQAVSLAGGVTVEDGALKVSKGTTLLSALTFKDGSSLIIDGERSLRIDHMSTMTLDGATSIEIGEADRLTIGLYGSDAAITGTGDLTVSGLGTLALHAENNYTGDTSISGGATVELADDGTLGSGDISIASGSSLAVFGTVNNATSLVAEITAKSAPQTIDGDETSPEDILPGATITNADVTTTGIVAKEGSTEASVANADINVSGTFRIDGVTLTNTTAAVTETGALTLNQVKLAEGTSLSAGGLGLSGNNDLTGMTVKVNAIDFTSGETPQSLTLSVLENATLTGGVLGEGTIITVAAEDVTLDLVDSSLAGATIAGQENGNTQLALTGTTLGFTAEEVGDAELGTAVYNATGSYQNVMLTGTMNISGVAWDGNSELELHFGSSVSIADETTLYFASSDDNPLAYIVHAGDVVGGTLYINKAAAAVPEPATATLSLLALAALAARRRRK